MVKQYKFNITKSNFEYNYINCIILFLFYSGTSYSELLEYINKIIITDGFSTKIPVEQRRVLRITISNLFSPIWDSKDMDVVSFLYKLRILIRSSYASCLITTRTQIINDVRRICYIFSTIHFNIFLLLDN